MFQFFCWLQKKKVFDKKIGNFVGEFCLPKFTRRMAHENVAFWIIAIRRERINFFNFCFFEENTMFSSFEVSWEHPATHTVSFREHNNVFSSKKQKLKYFFLKFFPKIYSPPPPGEFKGPCGYHNPSQEFMKIILGEVLCHPLLYSLSILVQKFSHKWIIQQMNMVISDRANLCFFPIFLSPQILYWIFRLKILWECSLA